MIEAGDRVIANWEWRPVYEKEKNEKWRGSTDGTREVEAAIGYLGSNHPLKCID